MKMLSGILAAMVVATVQAACAENSADMKSDMPADNSSRSAPSGTTTGSDMSTTPTTERSTQVAPGSQATVERGLEGTCNEMNWVALNGRVVLRVRDNSEQPTCLKRNWVINDRLVKALSQPTGPEDIRAINKGDAWGVYVKDMLLVTADEGDAQANNSTPKALARQWARNIQNNLPQTQPWGYQQAYLASRGMATDYSHNVASDQNNRTRRPSGSLNTASDPDIE